MSPSTGTSDEGHILHLRHTTSHIHVELSYSGNTFFASEVRTTSLYTMDKMTVTSVSCT